PLLLVCWLPVPVRFFSKPPKLTALCAPSLHDALPIFSVRLATGVSASPTVNGSAPVLVFWGIDWLVTSEIVGGVFGGGGGGGGTVPVSTNVSLADSPPPSVTVRVIVAVPL